MTKYDILQALENLGFTVEQLDDHYYHFEYEDENYLFVHYDGDEDFLHITIPAIFQVTDDNVDMVLPIINRTNNIVKYAKIIYAQDMVWASFEYPIFEWVNLEDLLEFAIKVLQGAAYTFNRVLHGDFDKAEGEEVQK